MNNLHALVMAAGEGKRMHSHLPKVIHKVCGRPMIGYILDSALSLTDQVLIIIGHGAEQVKTALGSEWSYVFQEKQLGTGHAVMQAMGHLPLQGTLFVLCGDTPLLEAKYLHKLLEHHHKQAATIATVFLPEPAGYGRIVRGTGNSVRAIIEDKDASETEKAICEINSGTYCFDLKILREYLPQLTTDNQQSEYYLTDVIAMMNRDGHQVSAYQIDDYRVGLGINNRVQLAEAASLLRKRINYDLMSAGVTMIDPDSTYIDYNVKIGPDTEIGPNCIIEGNSVIGSQCRIGPGVHLRQAVLGDQVSIEHAIIDGVAIEKGRQIAPFTVIKSRAGINNN